MNKETRNESKNDLRNDSRNDQKKQNQVDNKKKENPDKKNEVVNVVNKHAKDQQDFRQNRPGL